MLENTISIKEMANSAGVALIPWACNFGITLKKYWRVWVMRENPITLSICHPL
jgi:hypothetical protein